MPMLKIKSIEPEKIRAISKELIDELQGIIECPRDYFSISVDKPVYVKDGEIVEGEPIVEVSWFDRGQDIQDKVAQIITKYVNLVGHKNVDVIFYLLDKSKYYENGKHF